MFVVTILLFVGCTKESFDKQNITFSGSNTSNLIVSKMANEFNKSRNKNIQIVGGGSEKAIEQFLTGDLFCLNTSRRLTSDEIRETEALHGKKVKEVIIGLDVVSIIVNPKIGVNELSISQIKEIFQGLITNWKEIGGPDMPIHVYGRDNSSGTFHFMKQKFAPEGFLKNYRVKSDSKEIVTAIKNDIAGFAYTDIASISSKKHFPILDVWPINISIEGGQAVSPFENLAVLNGLYPLSRPLYQYFVDYNCKDVNEFIQFELSEKGQEIIYQNGFYKLQPFHIQLNRKNGF